MWHNFLEHRKLELGSRSVLSGKRRVDMAGQHRGEKYPPSSCYVVLTQAQHGGEKVTPPFVHPMATQEDEDFVLCCVVLCCVVLCCVVLCCVVLCCVVLCCDWGAFTTALLAWQML